MWFHVSVACEHVDSLLWRSSYRAVLNGQLLQTRVRDVSSQCRPLLTTPPLSSALGQQKINDFILLS